MDDEIRSQSTHEEAPQSQSRTTPVIDPTVLARLATALSTMQAPQGQMDATPTQASPSALGSDGLSAFLSNPAMLEKLPQIMAMLRPMLDTQATAQNSIHSQQSTAAAASQGSHLTDRDHLLLALKPFLSSERRDAVDSILRIAKLGELLKHL